MLNQSYRLPQRRHGLFQKTTGMWRLSLVVGLAAAFTALSVDKEMYSMQIQDDPRLYMDVNYYLSTMARKLGFHFTVHSLSGADTFLGTKEPLDPSLTTIDGVMKEVETRIPDAKCVLDRTDKNNPVVHLIDKALEKESEMLDRKIDFQYSGIVGKIPDELEKIVPGIGPRSGGLASGVVVATDLVTQVDIDVKQQSIRSILTHCVELDKYSRWIWDAETTRRADGTWKTEVWFAGPRKSK